MHGLDFEVVSSHGDFHLANSSGRSKGNITGARWPRLQWVSEAQRGILPCPGVHPLLTATASLLSPVRYGLHLRRRILYTFRVSPLGFSSISVSLPGLVPVPCSRSITFPGHSHSPLDNCHLYQWVVKSSPEQCLYRNTLSSVTPLT